MQTEIEEELVDKCLDQLKSWKKLIHKYLDGDEKICQIEKLKNTVKGFCEIDEQIKRNQRAFDKVDDFLEQTEDHSGIDTDKLFEEMLNSEPVTSNNNVTANHIWQTVFHNDEDIIIVEQKTKKTLDDSQYVAFDDSIMCSNTFSPTIDPISKLVIKNPYRNKKCKHVYEQSTIFNYIKQLKRKAKCPYIGCNNHLSANDLIEDSQLKVKLSQYLETHQDSQTSDSD